MFMKVKIEENGMLTGFPHHDGRVLAMGFLHENTFEITISSEQKKVNTLVISNVKLLSVDKVRESNIVDGFYVSPVSKLSNSSCIDIAKRFGFRSLEEFMSRHHDDNILEMTCSYGAELFAVIDDLSGIGLK